MDDRIEKLLIRLGLQNAAIDSHVAAFPRADRDAQQYADRMRLISYREETLNEICEYATVFAAAMGKL